MKFVEVNGSGTGFGLSKKRFPSVKKMLILKGVFDYDVIVTSQTFCGTHPGVLINRAQFHNRTFSSLGGV